MHNQINTTIQILLVRFDGQLIIPFAQAVVAAGYNVQTARNQLSNNSFPLKTELRGSRRFINIFDLAEYIDSLRGKTSKYKRGRPTKASKFKGISQRDM